ncbi:MAG: hypothetical protein AB9861_09920 [Methanosarcina sp.]|jgi:hypothetical protein
MLTLRIFKILLILASWEIVRNEIVNNKEFEVGLLLLVIFEKDIKIFFHNRGVSNAKS